jgi:2-polyprenyl-3-methyl-5-hydroxy-6-metoxy-1,4-benzoquinol methylase
LKENGNRVTGVDNLTNGTHLDSLEQYCRADLDNGIAPVIGALEGKRFERVLLLDLLEHLQRPEVLLRQCHEVLEPKGELIVSVPNVANITVRLMLLFGKFDYTDRGILDKTHLRFFTRKTVRRMVEESGFTILNEKLTVMPLEFVFGLSADHILTRMLNWVLAAFTKVLPGVLGYQIVFVAKSTNQET